MTKLSTKFTDKIRAGFSSFAKFVSKANKHDVAKILTETITLSARFCPIVLTPLAIFSKTLLICSESADNNQQENNEFLRLYLQLKEIINHQNDNVTSDFDTRLDIDEIKKKLENLECENKQQFQDLADNLFNKELFEELQKLNQNSELRFEKLSAELNTILNNDQELSHQLKELKDSSNKIQENFNSLSNNLEKLIKNGFEVISSDMKKISIKLDGSPRLCIETFDKIDEISDLFSYRVQAIDIFGREKEQEYLNNFVFKNSEEPENSNKSVGSNFFDNKMFRWTILSGAGGMGKSRLALDLCMKVKNEDWHAGFLDPYQKFSDWKDWKPRKPTLIVIDYAASRLHNERNLNNCILKLAEKAKGGDFKNPVRLLLLERDSNNNWSNKFWDTTDNKRRFQPTYYKLDKSDGYEPFTLGPLDEAAIKNIFLHVVPGDKHEKLKSNWSEIYKKFEDLDKSKRPLFAAFTALAYSENDDISHWNAEELVSSVLNRYVELWKRQGLDIQNTVNLNAKQHLALLVLATMCRGFELTNAFLKTVDEKFEEYFPKNTRHFHSNIYSILSGSNPNKQDKTFLNPLEPDILGELMVLSYFGAVESNISNETNLKNLEFMRDLASEININNYVSFLYMLFSDWQNNTNKTNSISDTIKKLVLPGHDNLKNMTGKDLAIYSMFKNLQIIYLLYKRNCFDDALKILEKLENLAKNFPKAEEIQVELANAYFNMSVLYCNNDDLNNVGIYIGKLEGLAEVFSETEEIQVRLAKAYVNMLALHDNNDDFSNVDIYIEKLENLVEKFPKAEEIQVELVKAYGIISVLYSNNDDLNNAGIYIGKLENLAKNFHEAEEIQVRLAKVKEAFNPGVGAQEA